MHTPNLQLVCSTGLLLYIFVKIYFNLHTIEWRRSELLSNLIQFGQNCLVHYITTYTVFKQNISTLLVRYTLKNGTLTRLFQKRLGWS